MAEAKTYLLVFDFSDGRISPEQINQYIMSAREVEAWWNHIPLVYIIRSRSITKALTDKFVKVESGARFLLAEVDGTNLNGWLPKVAWDWLTERDPAYSEVARALIRREGRTRGIEAITAEEH